MHPDEVHLLGLTDVSWTAQVVRAAVELGIPAALAAGPAPAEVVARRCAADEASMARLLDALVALGVCARHDDGPPDGPAYALAGPGRLLLDEPGAPSLGEWARWTATTLWSDWQGLAEAVRTGVSARSSRLGVDEFGPLAADAVAASTFHRGLAAVTAGQAPALVEAFGLRGSERVADVGGGQGELLIAVLRAHPEAQGLLVELPHALAEAGPRVAAAGVADRVRLVDADLFEPLPVVADVVVLKSVLHDWDDEAAARALASAAGAVADGGRLLVVERLRPERLDAVAEHRDLARMDLTMLVGQGGRERTESELVALVEGCGLRITRIDRPLGSLAVVEARA